jgi:L-lactate dehydrogenase complex protein LldG
LVEKTFMTEREKIIARIREALQTNAPHPGHHHGVDETSLPTEPPVAHAREWLPAVSSNSDEQLVLFAKNAADLKADFRLLHSPEEARETLLAIRNANNWQLAACHSGMLTDAVVPVIDLPLLRTDRPYEVQALEKCDVGISECDALIAQTGSVLVTNRSAGGRALSVLPQHHVVLARREQLVADLPAAMELLKTRYSPNYPSMISFITGPSRTGDIERILVLGAHGPKKLTILCV